MGLGEERGGGEEGSAQSSVIDHIFTRANDLLYSVISHFGPGGGPFFRSFRRCVIVLDSRTSYSSNS